MARTATSKPRVVAFRRRKLRNDFAWPKSTSQWIGQVAALAVLAVASMALPYYGARQLSGTVRAKAEMTKALLPQATLANAGSLSVANHEPGTEEVAKAATASPLTATISAAAPASDSHQAESRTSGRAEGRTDAELPRPGTQLSLTRELGLGVSRIAIDPGHGGSDTGTKGRDGLMEKDLCLDVALRLGRLIEASLPGAQVIYTRTDDRYVPLEERAAMANEANADLFISIHANSADSRETRGVETYYVSLAGSREEGEIATRENASAGYSLHNLPELVRKIMGNENLAESKQLATDIQTALSRRLQSVSRGEKNRGVKRAPFVVLTGANMPSVLSEISFVSNPSDEKLLLSGEQRQRITEGLYRGIAEYLGRMPDRTGAQRMTPAEVRRMASSGAASVDGLSSQGTRP